MAATLGFDVYGTLIDTRGVGALLQELVGEQADALARTWRDKQLEYAFRRGLMQNYADFATCTAQALDYSCAFHRQELDQSGRKRLLDAWSHLPAFGEAERALIALQADGHRLYAFSNGAAAAVEALLERAGIRQYFLGVISTDALKTFKPAPDVYALFLRQSGATRRDGWLVSGNPFDVIGALSAGLRAAWVRRSQDQLFDPWDIEPTFTVSSLDELTEALANAPSP